MRSSGVSGSRQNLQVPGLRVLKGCDVAVISDVRTWVTENPDAADKLSGAIRELQARATVEDKKAAGGSTAAARRLT